MAERAPDAIRSGPSESNIGQSAAANIPEMVAVTETYRGVAPPLQMLSSLPSSAAKDASFAQIRHGKRKRKPSRWAGIHRLDTFPHGQSASASSWGAAGVSDGGGDTTSSDEVEGDEAISPSVSPTVERIHSCLDDTLTPPPPRKRRHLGADDVGRFASMSIDQHQFHANTHPPCAIAQRPSEVVMPPSPSAHPAAPLDDELNESAFDVIPATVIEEPLDDDEDDDDIDMQARRGPSTIQVDKDRFVVTSLSDSEEDEDEVDDARENERERIDRAMRSAAAHPESVRPATAKTTDKSQGPALVINGDLVTRLQAMEWERKMALARDKTATSLLAERRRGGGTSTPTGKDDGSPPSALILWRQPDNLALNFGATSIPSVEPQAPAAPIPAPSPPVVLEDGQFAYVQRRAHSPSRVSTPTEANAAMDMDLDDD